MAEETFEMFITRERARLNGEREAIFTQQQELEAKLAEVDRELAAIDAYEAAKTGRAPARGRGGGVGRLRGGRALGAEASAMSCFG